MGQPESGAGLYRFVLIGAFALAAVVYLASLPRFAGSRIRTPVGGWQAYS